MTNPPSDILEALACRSCGSTMTRAELDAIGAMNCCPERLINEVIERDHGVPSLRALAAKDKGNE